MKNKLKDYKVILSCNKQGIVEQIFLDTGSLFESIKLPVGLHSLISPSSIKDFGSFWLSVQENSMEENTKLSLSYKEDNIDCIFSAYLLKDTVLFCGNTEPTATAKVLEGIMQINSEQANQIRLSEKKVIDFHKEVEGKQMNEAYLNDFSSLNNELINNKRELVRKNLKIESLNKELTAVNENMRMFTYSVSHDLNEPVRTIKSFLDLLHIKYGEILDQKGKTYLDFAIEGSNRQSRMMTDLLKYHQSSNFEIESVDLNEVFLEVKSILQKVIKDKNAQVGSERLPVLMGSSTAFIQIFQNLISNAIKFIPMDRTPLISIHVEEGDAHYTFRVKDNGIGIAEDQKGKVFDLFKRLNTQKKYEGTGMGLSMVKKSVERMGGEVWLESEEGKGSTFYFTIEKKLKGGTLN